MESIVHSQNKKITPATVVGFIFKKKLRKMYRSDFPSTPVAGVEAWMIVREFILLFNAAYFFAYDDIEDAP